MFFRSTRRTDDAFLDEAMSYADALHGVARRMCRNEALAEDLVQETLLKAIKSREQFTAGTNLRSWLFRILTNVWVSRYRRASLERATFDAPDVDPIADGWVSAETMRNLREPEELAVASLLRAELERALELLPEDFRMVVLLVDAAVRIRWGRAWRLGFHGRLACGWRELGTTQWGFPTLGKDYA